MGKRFLWREKWSGELLAERFPERAVEGGCGFAGGWCEECWPGGGTPCVLRWFQRRRTGRWCNCLGRSRRFILCCARCGCCRSMDGHGDAPMRRCELGCRGPIFTKKGSKGRPIHTAAKLKSLHCLAPSTSSGN